MSAPLARGSTTACEASASVKNVLDELRKPGDIREAATERKRKKLELLQSALELSPRDIFLPSEYQDIKMGFPVELYRPEVIDEYEALLEKNPTDAIYLYLAARAQYGRKTKQALSYVERAVKVEPEFPWPYLLLAEIHLSPTFQDRDKALAAIEEFHQICPSSPASIRGLAGSRDAELQAETAQRLREALQRRADTEALIAYPNLWRLESADKRSDDLGDFQRRLEKDLELLTIAAFPRNVEWLETIRTGSQMLKDSSFYMMALEQMAALYPHSNIPMRLEWNRWVQSHPYPSRQGGAAVKQAHFEGYFRKARALARRWPAVFPAASLYWRGVTLYQGASSQSVKHALDNLIAAWSRDPDGNLSFPPQQISAATFLAEKALFLEQVRPLVFQGLEMVEKMWGPQQESDLWEGSGRAREFRAAMHSTAGQFALAEAYLKLDELPAMRSLLFQLEDKLNRTRPDESAHTRERSWHAEREAQFWYMKGLLAEKEGRRLDALVLYRNAMVSFPPQRERKDRRSEVQEAAQRLWEEMSGTNQGWNDWAAHSSLKTFYAGSGGPNAWRLFAEASPERVLTDGHGKKWKPSELQDKTTFVNVWATWCIPCRAELPYLQRLYERFKDRNGVVILALNVDDDPSLMQPFLGELGLTLPSIAARDFAYDLVPPMALPSNWIMNPERTEMFYLRGDDTLEEWFEAASEAIEKASGG